MERNLLKRNLARTEKRIAQGHEHVERQRQIVAELERKGQTVGRSGDLLKLFIATLEAHLDERNRLKSELAQE